MAKKQGLQAQIPTMRLPESFGTTPAAGNDDAGFRTQALAMPHETVEALRPDQLLSTTDLLLKFHGAGIVEIPGGARVEANSDAYRIIERVQGGAMSSTYKATHELTGKQVFLKILDGKIAPPGIMPAEIHNIEECRDLEHVVQVHRSHLDLRYAGTLLPPAIVTQWVEGPTLDELLKEPQRITFQESLAITEQIAQGLMRLHQAGIIHRDIKPSNIKLVETGHKEPWRKYDVKILDLGIGVKLRDMVIDEHRDRIHRYFIGTPYYASPEQILEMPLKTFSDVYSMGMIAAELALKDTLNGRALREKTVQALLYASKLHEFSVPRIPRKFIGSPDELFAYNYLRRIALHALQADPEARPTADALAHQLSKRSRIYSRIKMTSAAAGASLILALGVGAPLLNEYHERKGAQALSAEQLRLELSVYNPNRLNAAGAMISRARGFLEVQDFLESERLCTDAQQTLRAYRQHPRAGDRAQFSTLRRSADLCLAEAFLGQKEYGSAQAAFAKLGRVTDDRGRILGREIALSGAGASHDAVINDLRQVWRGRKELWAGNKLTEALTFKASQISDKSARKQQYGIALEHAGTMIRLLQPSPMTIDAAGEQHALPSEPLPLPGQMQELERAFLNRATVYRRLGEYALARADIGEAVQLAQTLNDRLMLARSLMHLGVIEFHTANFHSADTAFSGAIEQLRTAESLGHLAEALSKRGVIRNQLSMPAEASADAHEATLLYRRFGNERDEILGSRYTESLALLSLGRLTETIGFAQEAIGRSMAYGNVERAGDYANIALEGICYAGAPRESLDRAYAEAAKHLAGFEDSYRNVYADILYAYGLEELGAADDALKALATAAAKPAYDDYNRGLGVALQAMIASKHAAAPMPRLADIDALIAANGGTHEVLARLYVAQGVARVAKGMPAQESFLAAVQEADATKNIYHALDVRMDIAPVADPALQGLLCEQVRMALAGGDGVPFMGAAYRTDGFKALASRSCAIPR